MVTVACAVALLSAACLPPRNVQSAEFSGRDPRVWPFAASSPFNTPRGDGATFDPRPVAGGCGINTVRWGVSVQGGGSPWVPQTDGSENHTTVIRPDGVTADEYYRYQLPGQRGVVVNLRGSGVDPAYWRVSDMSQLGGLIRQWDLDQGTIPHTLEIGLSQNILATYAVWPTSGRHLDGFAPSNTGFVPYGALVAIPSNAPVPAGLSRAGQMIWTALRNFGAYVASARNDFSGGCALYAEAAADGSVNPARGEMGRIFSQVRLVTNSTAGSVGGPGPRLAPFAPGI